MTEEMVVVQIIKDATGEVVRESKPTSRWRAEKIEDGLGINLDWNRYSTRIQAAPGVAVSGRRVWRILKAGDPRGDDYREAEAWVKDIRSRLVHIRGELHDVGRIEAISERDRTCEDVAGALTLAIRSLYDLLDGERSFGASAERLDALWADVEANPDAYVIEEGTTMAKRGQKSDQPWEWKPWGIFKRGGRKS